MAKRWFMVLFMALGLAGCGDAGTEVSARVAMAPANVYAILSEGSVAEAAPLLPGIEVEQSRPSENELLFAFPAQNGQDPATIRFRLEPLDGGTATNVVAIVKTPDVKAKIGGQMKMLSEALVAGQVRKVIKSMGPQTDSVSVRDEVSSLLIAVAIATDPELLEKALAMSSDSTSLLESLMADAIEEAAAAPEGQDDNDPTEFATVEDGSEQIAREEALAAERPEFEIVE